MKLSPRLERLQDILWAILRPSYWISSDSKICDKEWDSEVRRLIRDGAKPRRDIYTVHLGGYRIWNSNYPHAYGENYKTKRMPYRRTRKLLRDYLLTHRIEECK